MSAYRWLAFIVITVLGFILYFNAFSNSFHFDDFPQIVDDQAIRNLNDLGAIWQHWPTRFVAYFSFALNYHWGGTQVFGYHLFSLLIHVASALLVWRFMLLTLNAPVLRKEISPVHAPWIALFTALIFLTHPLQTQAVNYIVQRAVLLAAFFYMAALVLYIKGQESRWSYALSLVCASLAMLSKEHAVTLPLMICLYQGFFLSENKPFPWKRIAPFFLVVLIIPLAWHSIVMTGIGKTVEGFAQGMTGGQYALTQAEVVVTYLKLLIFPLHQRVDYDFTLATSFFSGPVLGSVLFLLLIFGIAVFMKKKYRLLSFGICWFFLTLLPESSFWPIKDLIFEHRLYLPLLGFGIFLTSTVFYFFQTKKTFVAIGILSLLVVGYSFLTYQRNKVWKNELTLWDDAVRQSPKSARAYLNRGAAYQRIGDLDHAMADYNMVIGLGPVDAVTLSNRGSIFLEKGDFDHALANFNLAIKIWPGFSGTYVNRGKLYQREGKLDLALKDFNQAITIAPNIADDYMIRGAFYSSTGDFDHALSDYNMASLMQPHNPEIYGARAAIYFQKKDYAHCWQDVHQVEALGASIKKEYIEELRRVSGRDQ